VKKRRDGEVIWLIVFGHDDEEVSFRCIAQGSGFVVQEQTVLGWKDSGEPDGNNPLDLLARVVGERLPKRRGLTKKQLELMESLVPRGRYLRGAEVRIAQRLKGLVQLDDNGEMRTGPGGRSDGERWTAELTDAGRAMMSRVPAPGWCVSCYRAPAAMARST